MKPNSAAAIFVLPLLAVVIVSLGAFQVSGALSVNADKNAYNLGDEITVSYDFSRDQDFSGLVKLSLLCSNFGLEFYTLPTNIFAGQTQGVTVPPLTISQSMLGRCYVSANATSYDVSINESSTSNFFNVTNSISVSAVADKKIYLPSERVEVSGEAAKSHFLPAGVVMTFLGNNYVITLVNNSFAYDIKLPRNMKSGKHVLGFLVNDSFGNSGSASLEFGVEAVPTSLANSISNQSVRPGQEFLVSVVAYDQAEDRMQSDVVLAVNDSSGNVVLSATGSTSSGIALKFPQGQKPGAYTLISSALGLVASSRLVVEEVENVTVSLENKTVVLENTGNVNYVKTFNITLSGNKGYTILHDVELAPGEAFEVDLSTAVSSGDYNVSFPTVAEAQPVENLHLDDERSFLKKSSDFLGITGRAVQVTSTGTGKIQAKFAPLLLFVIIAVLAFYFARNRKKGGGQAAKPVGQSQKGGEESSSGYKPVSHVDVEGADEEARIRRIIEEKRRLQMQREPPKPTNLRDDPDTKKFITNVMKDKPFR